MASWACPSCQAPNDEAAEACFACGKGHTALTRGSLLAGRYEILESLGSGGMGSVYKAHDQVLDEVVAVKVLRSARAPEMSARFKAEIKLARKVSHRNVCRIHEYGVEGLRHYISMEFVDGRDLRRHLAARGSLPPEEALGLALQIGKGLQAIHDAGVIHRDLKAGNIMLDGAGVVRLMDFGVAKKSDPSGGARATAMVLGTPEYMSPEQALGASVDFRTDIYSFAIVIYELLTGRLPFIGDTPIVTIFKHLKEPPPLDGEAGARLPPALVPVLRRALSKEPGDRYASVRGMVAALRSVQSTGSAAAVAEPAPASTPTETSVPTAGAGFRPAPPSDLPERIESCVVALTDAVAHVRWRAAVDLWEIGPPAAAAIGALSTALADTDTAVAEAAARALKSVAGLGAGPGADAGPSTVRWSAADTLIQGLEHEEVLIRRRAAVALGVLGPEARSSLGPLARALKDRDAGVRESAALALGKIGSATGEAVHHLVQVLADPEPSVRAAAAVALGRLGADASSPRTTEAAIPVRTGAGPATARVAPLVAALVDALKDTDRVVRSRAAQSLGEMGPSARNAVPALIEALEDTEASVATAATSALEQIVESRRTPAPSVPSAQISLTARPAIDTLIAGLKHRDAAVRWRAAVALGESGPRAAAAVPALIEALDESDDAVRWEAAKALERMGEAAQDAVPALAAALHGERDSILRRRSAEALGAMGPAAREGVPPLIAALNDVESAVSQAAAEALLKIGREAVPALIEALKDEDGGIRARAAEIVTTMGKGWSAQKQSEGSPSDSRPQQWANRRSPRVDVALRVRLRRPEARAGEQKEELTVTENLSEGGAKLVTSLPVGKGELVDLEEVEGPLRARALVLDVSIGADKNPRLHLQFFDVEPRARLQEILERGAP